MKLGEHNLREIEGLSQRGRTLSIVDLIAANTLNVDMAAYSLYAIANGTSFLTAARPGNAGKTTLMACLLTFLPPGVKIVTISNPSVVTEVHGLMGSENPDKLCFLCHEIGSGHWYGYLWGRYVGQFLHLMNDGCRIASCIHADTLSETLDILVSKKLGVSEEDFARLGLILFMKLERGLMEYKRRVSTFYESGEQGRHNLLFTWEPKSDTYNQLGDSLLLKRVALQNGRSMEQVARELRQCKLFIEGLMASGKTDFRWVRKQVLDFYSTSLQLFPGVQ
jgi:hypothetical protein